VAETNQLVAWMETAFEACAEGSSDNGWTCEPYETPEQCSAQIRRYKTEFSRILRGTADYYVADTKLPDDLYSLMKLDCPALDIVELMLACTNWFAGDISNFVEALGIPEKLNTIRKNCRHMAEAISALNMRALPVRPHDFLRAQFPNNRERRRARSLINSLPDALHYLEKLLEKYPSVPDPVIKAGWKHGVEAYLYALLRYFGQIEVSRGSRPRNWYVTLSSLLQAIRAVRLTASPDAAHSRNIAEIPIRSGKGKGESKDPLSDFALQQRLDRFFKTYPRFPFAIDVFQYMTDDYAESRRRGETLLRLLPQLEKDRFACEPRIAQGNRTRTDRKSKGRAAAAVKAVSKSSR